MFSYTIDTKELFNVVKSFEPNGDAQKFFTSELMRLSDNYTPFNSGALKNTVQMSKDGTAIIYNVPYARYLWYGQLMVDPITGKGAFYKEGYGFWSRPNTKKVLTDIPLNYQGSPLRGSRWAERCFNDNKDYFESAVVNYARRLKK